METVEHILCGDYVVTMGEPDVITGGAVAVDKGVIVDVGSRKAVLSKYSSNNLMEGKGKAFLPGLVNTHTHAAMALMRGLADDLPLKDWLEKHIWPVENVWLGPEFIEDAMALACLEMLKAGVTTFNDMYFFEDVAARVIKKIGARAVLGAGIIDLPTKTTSGPEDCLQKAERFTKEWKGDGLITPAIAPHAAYTCSPETLKRSAELAYKMEAPLHIHLSESRWEVEEVKRRYGRTPGMHLESLGILNRKLVAAHCVHVTEEEIDLFAERGVSVSHCIESNLKLASGIAPIPAMLKAGVRVTFGTDGAASNNDLSILGEMSTAAKLHKAVSGDATVLDSKTALLMATRWGAEALGLNTGALEPGRQADIITVDMEKPHLKPLYNIFSHVVYCMRPSDVTDVMVDGGWVVKKGRLVSMDEGEILSRADLWGGRIKEGLKSRFV